MMKELWKQLKSFRENQRNPATGRTFTQKEVAAAIGKNQGYLSRLENGDFKSPDADVVNKLAAAFSLKRSVFLNSLEKLATVTNKPSDVKITSHPPIEKYGQHWQPKGFPYNDGVLKDNPEYIDCPPFLQNVENAYAIVMPDNMMRPRYRPGDILYVNPEISAMPSDDVIIELKFHERTMCIVREVINVKPPPLDGESRFWQYGVMSLARKEVINTLYDIQQSHEEEPEPFFDTLFSKWERDCDWVTLAEDGVGNIQVDTDYNSLEVNMHPIVGTQLCRYQQRNYIDVRAKAGISIKAIGEATVKTSTETAE